MRHYPKYRAIKNARRNLFDELVEGMSSLAGRRASVNLLEGPEGDQDFKTLTENPDFPAGEQNSSPEGADPAAIAIGDRFASHAMPFVMHWLGLEIVIENPAGTIRSGTSRDGDSWEIELQDHYGFIKRTKGEDGEGVDVFVNPDADETQDTPIFVVHQEVNGEYDEDKVMIGYTDAEEAETAYLRNYEDGWEGLGEMDELSDADFLNEYLREYEAKQAQVNSLNELTQNVNLPTGPHAEIDDAHHDENTSEDVDLHMASVEAPYSDGGGPLATEFEEDPDEVKVVNAMNHKIGRGLDPYKMGRIYRYDELLPQHRDEIDVNDGLGRRRRSFIWLRTAMPVTQLIDESAQWYHKNISKRWKMADRERMLNLAERFMKGATCTPVLVSAPGEKNGGLWEGYHRVRAHALIAIEHCPVVMKIDPKDAHWQERVAAFAREPWVCVDLDGTLENDEETDSDEPMAGAVEALQRMLDAGWRVSVWTARQSEDNPDWKKDVAAWLKKYDVPHTDIYEGGKPPADVFVDNNAVRFAGDWDNTFDEVETTIKEHKAAGLIGNGDDMADSYTNVDGQRDDLAVSRDDLSELDVKTARRK